MEQNSKDSNIVQFRFQTTQTYRWADYVVLASAIAISRIVFRSHYLYDIDSVNFALGMVRFDPMVHQPHPPGYYLYVILARAVNLLFHDANSSLVAISIVCSCGTAAMIYALANRWFGRSAARFAGAAVLFSPLAWFHGIVALTYIVEAFFSSLMGYLCWRAYSGEIRFLTLGAATLGVAAGFRPSSCLFLSPLLILSLRKATGAQVARTAAVLLATVLAWMIPMLWQSGGAQAYMSPLVSLWLMVPGKNTVVNSSIATSVARFATIIGIAVLIFGAAVTSTGVPLVSGSGLDRLKKQFIWAWITPGLLFFTFVFLKFVNSGYLLVIAPPLFALIGFWASEWYRKPSWANAGVKLGFVVVLAAVNVLIFVRAPLYCSYGELRVFERQLQDLRRQLPMAARARDVMIVAFDSHFLGFRHAGYYFPEYVTLEYPEVRYPSGPRVFVMHARDTQLAQTIGTAPYEKFIFFPLPPAGNEYREYLQGVRNRFPNGVLETVKAGEWEFVMGPVSALPALFPRTAR